LNEEVGKPGVELQGHCVLDGSERVVKSHLYPIRFGHSSDFASDRNPADVCNVYLQIVGQIVSEDEGRLFLGKYPLAKGDSNVRCFSVFSKPFEIIWMYRLFHE